MSSRAYGAATHVTWSKWVIRFCTDILEVIRTYYISFGENVELFIPLKAIKIQFALKPLLYHYQNVHLKVNKRASPCILDSPAHHMCGSACLLVVFRRSSVSVYPTKGHRQRGHAKAVLYILRLLWTTIQISLHIFAILRQSNKDKEE